MFMIHMYSIDVCLLYVCMVSGCVRVCVCVCVCVCMCVCVILYLYMILISGEECN